MANDKQKSSKKALEALSKKAESEGKSEEMIYRFQSEIEKGMEEFDMDKRKKDAQAIDDLSKLVITT